VETSLKIIMVNSMIKIIFCILIVFTLCSFSNYKEITTQNKIYLYIHSVYKLTQKSMIKSLELKPLSLLKTA